MIQIKLDHYVYVLLERKLLQEEKTKKSKKK